MFRARFLALKRTDRLDDAERARLEAIFAARAELARAWAMLQELYGLYAAEDLAGAEEHLDRFARMWGTDRLPEFYRVASDVIRWAPEIFNFHRAGRCPTDASRAHETAVGAIAPGWVQVLPTDGAPYGSYSNLNVERAGQTIPNAVITKLGTAGQFTASPSRARTW